jgi:hypothetical protein
MGILEFMIAPVASQIAKKGDLTERWTLSGHRKYDCDIRKRLVSIEVSKPTGEINQRRFSVV